MNRPKYIQIHTLHTRTGPPLEAPNSQTRPILLSQKCLGYDQAQVQSQKTHHTFQNKTADPSRLISNLPEEDQQNHAKQLVQINQAIHSDYSLTLHQTETEPDGSITLVAITYSYLSIDIPKMVCNLENTNVQLWERIKAPRTTNLIQFLLKSLLLTRDPSAPQDSPYKTAPLMMIEKGQEEPRSLGHAFYSNRSINQRNAFRALAEHLVQLDKTYGLHQCRRILSQQYPNIYPAKELSAAELYNWATQELDQPQKTG